MTSKPLSYLNLARSVISELNRRKVKSPSISVLEELFAVLFFASLKTEEGQDITAHVVYLDPKEPDPDPPENIRALRWQYFALSERIALSVANLVKLAKASDPRTSSFAVYHDRSGKLFIWGLVDQGNSYHEFVNLDCSSGFSRPGIFQASVIGAGHLVAYRELEKIAELRLDSLVNASTNVLRSGPVLEKLKPGIATFISKVRRKVRDDKVFAGWPSELAREWLSSLCRILLRVQNFRHGGAILITPDSKELNLKYRINYRRLDLELHALHLAQIKSSVASNKLMKITARHEESVPAETYLDETIAEAQKEDCEKALASIIWFISLLTRVDGLVLLSPSLDVRAFGVEITTDARPKDVFISKTAISSSRSLRRIDYNHFGTRHRSMMRYCAKFPNSVGFVVSQDGDVRAITKVGQKLVMWDNVRLQLHDWLD